MRLRRNIPLARSAYANGKTFGISRREVTRVANPACCFPDIDCPLLLSEVIGIVREPELLVSSPAILI